MLPGQPRGQGVGGQPLPQLGGGGGAVTAARGLLAQGRFGPQQRGLGQLHPLLLALLGQGRRSRVVDRRSGQPMSGADQER